MFSSVILYCRSLFIARRRNRLKFPHAHKRSNVAVTKIPFFKLEIFDFVKFVKNNLKFVETCKKCQTRVNLPKVPENVLF